jgi:hypothetical protein
MAIQQIIDTEKHPVLDQEFRAKCKDTLDQTGVLILRKFLRTPAIATIYQEALNGCDKAYFCTQSHNVYLTEADPDFASDHPRNREVISSKGCICDDIIAAQSPLRHLYNSEDFKFFLRTILGEQALYEYADPLSSINLHYAKPGQELGWHFDNSSFAITLMIKAPKKGGQFEYVSEMRNSEQGEMNFDGVGAVLDGKTPVETLNQEPGTLVLFRGRDAIHRVAPVEGGNRILVVLAYNTEPGIALSEAARQTFFGRLG